MRLDRTEHKTPVIGPSSDRRVAYDNLDTVDMLPVNDLGTRRSSRPDSPESWSRM
jgi:hypothetical protein